MKNVMFARRFIQTRFMCNFLQEKHQLKLSLSVKRNFQAPPRAPFGRDDGSCGHFVVEELICKAHFNDIKNLPMEERILLCKYALTRKPIVINVTTTARRRRRRRR